MLVLKVPQTDEDIESIVSLADIKAFMRILSTDDDELIKNMIKSAINEANQRTSLNFITATFELYLERFQNQIVLPKNPIQEIVSIEYMDSDKNYVLLDPQHYYMWKAHDVDTVVFDYFPTSLRHKKAVKITFKSGFTVENFPSEILQWLKVRVSTLFEYREEFITGATVSKVSHVDSVLRRYKIRYF